MGYNAASAAKFKFEILDFDYELSVVSFDVKETVSEPFVINLRLAGEEKITFEDVKLQEGLLAVAGGVGAIYVVMNQSETIGVNKSIQVGANHTETIGSNMTLTVGKCQTETIGVNSMETIGADKELSIGGLYQVSVGGIMNETVSCAKTEEVGQAKSVFVGTNMTKNIVGDSTTNIGANLSEFITGKYYSKANEYVIEAPKITFKAGSSTITMDDGSITIKANKVFSN